MGQSQRQPQIIRTEQPWTNGQVERMNRTIKEATVKRFHYDNHSQLETHLVNFISAYNFGRRLKTLKGLTPYEFICKQWTIEPERFTLHPIHQMSGLNNIRRNSTTTASCARVSVVARSCAVCERSSKLVRPRQR